MAGGAIGELYRLEAAHVPWLKIFRLKTTANDTRKIPPAEFITSTAAQLAKFCDAVLLISSVDLGKLYRRKLVLSPLEIREFRNPTATDPLKDIF